MGFFVRVRGLGRFFGAGVGGTAVGVSCAARGRSVVFARGALGVG